MMAEDGTALLYDAPTGFTSASRSVRRPRTLAVGVLRPDGLELAVSMPEGVMVWDIDPDHQFEYACRIAGRDLTENEWRTYLVVLGAAAEHVRFRRLSACDGRPPECGGGRRRRSCSPGGLTGSGRHRPGVAVDASSAILWRTSSSTT